MNNFQIPYVTTNKGKFQEISHFLTEYTHLPFFLAQEAFETTEIQSDDQKEIAGHKAREAWNHFKRPLLVEDAGFFFEKYHNFPGTFSKWIFKSLGFKGVSKLYQPGEKAYFKVTLCFIENPESLHFFTVESHGTLAAPSANYNAHLPYSALFIPDGYTENYQKLSDAKSPGDFYPRKMVIKKFIEWFKSPREISRHSPSSDGG